MLDELENKPKYAYKSPKNVKKVSQARIIQNEKQLIKSATR